MNEEEIKKEKTVPPNKYYLGDEVYYCNKDFEIKSGTVTDFQAHLYADCHCYDYWIDRKAHCEERDLGRVSEEGRKNIITSLREQEKSEVEEIRTQETEIHTRYAKIIEKLSRNEKD